ncbi:MAG: AIR synthase-related protein, partial [Leuconostoc lactis]
IGATQASFNGSEIQKMQTGTIDGQLFEFDDAAEMAAQTLVRQAIGQQLLASAHDLAEGGLIVGLLESSFAGQLSFNVNTNLATPYLFAETPSRFVVSVAADKVAAFEALAGDLATRIGDVTTGDDIVVATTTDEIVLSRQAAQKVYQESISWQLQA